jgi:hypothetical protein
MRGQATLLVVDDVLLLRIAKDLLGQAALDDDSTPETGGNLLPYVLSFWLAGADASFRALPLVLCTSTCCLQLHCYYASFLSSDSEDGGEGEEQYACAGGREAFLWAVVKSIAANKLERPLVVFIRDVEHTICSTFERHEGFVSAFGSIAQPGSPLGAQRMSCSGDGLLSGSNTSCGHQVVQHACDHKNELLHAALQQVLGRMLGRQRGRQRGASGCPCC